MEQDRKAGLAEPGHGAPIFGNVASLSQDFGLASVLDEDARVWLLDRKSLASEVWGKLRIGMRVRIFHDEKWIAVDLMPASEI